MAIHDERRLKFGIDAVMSCLRGAGAAGHVLNLPSGDLDRALLVPGTQTVEARFTVREGGNIRTVSSHLTSPQIAALLISYCVSLRIPLPRKSAKRIMIDSSNVTITFEQTIDVGGAALPSNGTT